MNGDPFDLLAHAATVIDRLDDIDDIASIGGPMDELATLLNEIALVEAISETIRNLPAERIHDMLRQDAPLTWRVQWLMRHTGCTTATAELLGATPAERFASLTRTGDLDRLREVMESAARAVADDLRDQLGDQVGSTVPDTIPVRWR